MKRSFLERVSRAYKAFAGESPERGTWTTIYGSRTEDILIDSRTLRERVGDLTLSSLAMAAVLFLGKSLAEAPVIVTEKDKDSRQWNPIEHQLTDLMERPNPWSGGRIFWLSYALDWYINGNVYWKIERDGLGQPKELWWIPYDRMKPHWPTGQTTTYIDYYEYWAGSSIQQFNPDDVIHFRHGQDPKNVRMGWAPLRPVLAEIYTDRQISLFCGQVMRHGGLVTYMLAPKEGVSEFDPEAMQNRLEAATNGENRGRPPISDQPIEKIDLAIEPRKLALSDMRDTPESRVASVTGIAPVVLHFMAGLKQATYSNYEQAREQSYESGVIPVQEIIGDELRAQLLSQYRDQGKAKRKVIFDLSEVRILQEDRDKRVERNSAAVEAGWMQVAEARAAEGLPWSESDQVYLRGSQIVGVPAIVKSRGKLEEKAIAEPATLAEISDDDLSRAGDFWNTNAPAFATGMLDAQLEA